MRCNENFTCMPEQTRTKSDLRFRRVFIVHSWFSPWVNTYTGLEESLHGLASNTEPKEKSRWQFRKGHSRQAQTVSATSHATVHVNCNEIHATEDRNSNGHFKDISTDNSSRHRTAKHGGDSSSKGAKASLKWASHSINHCCRASARQEMWASNITHTKDRRTQWHTECFDHVCKLLGILGIPVPVVKRRFEFKQTKRELQLQANHTHRKSCRKSWTASIEIPNEKTISGQSYTLQ